MRPDFGSKSSMASSMGPLLLEPLLRFPLIPNLSCKPDSSHPQTIIIATS